MEATKFFFVSIKILIDNSVTVKCVCSNYTRQNLELILYSFMLPRMKTTKKQSWACKMLSCVSAYCSEENAVWIGQWLKHKKE
jgi:hypothetical protein